MGPYAVGTDASALKVGAVRPGHLTVILLDAINNYWDDFAAARLRLLKMVDTLREGVRVLT